MTTIPDRVAIETLRGRVTAVDVVDEELVASTEQTEHRLLVDLGPARLWVSADEAEPV